MGLKSLDAARLPAWQLLEDLQLRWRPPIVAGCGRPFSAPGLTECHSHTESRSVFAETIGRRIE